MVIALLAIIVAIMLWGPEPVRRYLSGFGRIAYALVMAFLSWLVSERWWVAAIVFVIALIQKRGNGRRE
jgi:MFS-type transporter involved in bile tolerance (Atg22 family)